eukprot:g13994.t2
MQLLRRACLSGLGVLSGRRSSSAPSSSAALPAAPATAARRFFSRMPAWRSGSVFKRGGGTLLVDGRFSAKLHMGGEVPLVQAIYEELSSLEDPEAEARAGLDSPVISKVLKLMDKLEPRDLGLAEQDFQGLTHSLCIPVFVDEQSFFEMTVFVLPTLGEIPLHDHPNMAVLSRVLFGSLGIDSYDIDVGMNEPGDTDGTRGGPIGQDRPVRRRQRRREETRARRAGWRQQHRVATASTPSFLLTPSEGNVHAFKAPAACAVFDVLIPPYDAPRGRKCSYFRVDTTVSGPQCETAAGRTAESADADMDGSHEGVVGIDPTE